MNQRSEVIKMTLLANTSQLGSKSRKQQESPFECCLDTEQENGMYKIVRHYFESSRKRTIDTGLSLEEAQAHCSDPETSSSTCTSAASRRITRRSGPWFDGYQET